MTDPQAPEDFQVTEENIAPYFKKDKRHSYYNQTVYLYSHMSFHLDGYELNMPTTTDIVVSSINNQEVRDNRPQARIFERLIDIRRPSESDSIKTYRRAIYNPVTKTPCFKVYNSLRKIVKASDWCIDYKSVEKPSTIADGEYLEDYCEYKYPYFNSVENWWYNYGMRRMFTDANALIYVLPLSWEKESEADYYEPVANIVYSDKVYDFVDEQYAIFELEKKWEYEQKNGVKRKGKILGIITRFGYWEARQTNAQQDFEIIEIAIYDKPMDYLPAWHIGGVPKKITERTRIYESFLSPMLSGLDAMARESSDADADVVQHMYLTMWYFTQQDCKHCMGKGKVNGKGKQLITCSECNGTGNAPKSPYRDVVLKAGTFDSDKMPTPPAGYVIKPTDIVELMMKRIDNHEYQALAAVNHEFLANNPVRQTAEGKAMDKQELDNFAYSVAYHSVANVLDDVYYFINWFRYSGLIKDEETLSLMLPKIAIPQNYDLLSEAVIEAQMKSAKDSGASADIMFALEEQYVGKKFPNDSRLRDAMRCIRVLDKLHGKTDDEVDAGLLTKRIKIEDAILHTYISFFVDRAIDEHPEENGNKGKGFLEMSYDEKMAIIKPMLDEVVSDLDKAQKLKMKQQQAQKPDPSSGIPPGDPNAMK